MTDSSAANNTNHLEIIKLWDVQRREALRVLEEDYLAKKRKALDALQEDYVARKNDIDQYYIKKLSQVQTSFNEKHQVDHDCTQVTPQKAEHWCESCEAHSRSLRQQDDNSMIPSWWD